MDHESNRRSLNLLYSIFIISYVCGLAFFISGFMTININKLSYASIKSIPAEPDFVRSEDFLPHLKNENLHPMLYNPRFSKTVIVVIDALRADFLSILSPHSKFKLPFVENLIKNGRAISYINNVFSPTVTLPRLKTMLTGTTTNFLDVLINFNAVELQEDNLLYQAQLKQYKTIFYGDNVWLKLFPNYFLRSEGTHSFFVTDFIEVDDNVTRHLDSELSNIDWNIMILHYLGVDHIGHAHSPQSPHMPVKLKELDGIIKNIYMQLKEKTSPSLIMICGDHGMTPSGSHGGVSKSELLTPLIFINTNDSQYFQLSNSKHVSQVDIAATLSVLLGLPIPANSMGNVIPEVLHFSGMTPRQVLHAVYYNLVQLTEVHNLFLKENVLYSNSVQEIILRHNSWLKFNMNKNRDGADPDFKFLLKAYSSILSDLKHELLGNFNTHNDPLMISGICIQWISLIIFSTALLANLKSNVFQKLMAEFKKNSKMNILVILVLTILSCWFYGLTVAQSCFLFFTGVILFILSCVLYFLLRFYVNMFCTITERLLHLLLLFHLLSLFSTSYIEEEHQTWYFLSVTILLIYLIRNVVTMFMHLKKNEDKIKICKNSDNGYLTYFFHADIWQLFLRVQTDSNIITSPIIILVTHRLFRCWNQTGDKWSHLPDIVDWLNEPKNLKIHYVLVTISQLIVLYLISGKCSQLIQRMANFGILTVHMYQYYLFFGSLSLLGNKNLSIAWFVYFQAAVIIITAMGNLVWENHNPLRLANFIISFIIAWLLLTMLIGRVHNIPLLMGVLLQEHYLSKITWNINPHLFTNAICYIAMASSSYFYLGNSNSLSTIDVITGYTGLVSYEPLLVGLLLTCNTYSTLILWVLLMYYRIFSTNNMKRDEKEFEQHVCRKAVYCSLALISYRLLILSMYCVVMYIQKHHLFVLTVFAPKLFYEVAHTVVFVIISLFVILVSWCRL